MDSCHQLLRVFELCCLIGGVPPTQYPVVSLDLAGFALDAECFQTCVLLVQSYTLSVGYSHQSFFSDHTLVVVEKAISNAGVFFGISAVMKWMIPSPNIALCLLLSLRLDVRPSMLIILSVKL